MDLQVTCHVEISNVYCKIHRWLKSVYWCQYFVGCWPVRHPVLLVLPDNGLQTDMLLHNLPSCDRNSLPIGVLNGLRARAVFDNADRLSNGQ